MGPDQRGSNGGIADTTGRRQQRPSRRRLTAVFDITPVIDGTVKYHGHRFPTAAPVDRLRHQRHVAHGIGYQHHAGPWRAIRVSTDGSTWFDATQNTARPGAM
jgi:hypothetical protein